MTQPPTNLKTTCPLCGGESFEWGRVIAHSLQYVNDRESFWEKLKRGLRGTMPARKCNTCKNVQIFAQE